jgi:hypothetical protein
MSLMKKRIDCKIIIQDFVKPLRIFPIVRAI